MFAAALDLSTSWFSAAHQLQESYRILQGRILQEFQLGGPSAVVTMPFPVPGLESQLSFKLSVSRENGEKTEEMLGFFFSLEVKQKYPSKISRATPCPSPTSW